MENLILTEEIQDLNEYGSEQLKAKFTAFGKKTFGFVRDDTKDISGTLKKYTRLSAFNLPEPLNEPFIKQELFYLFWIADSHLLSLFERSFKLNNNNGVTESYLALKKLYSKWVNAKNEEERKYCAKSFINKTENGALKENPLLLMLKGSIFSVDPIFYSTVNALAAFDQAEKASKKVLNTDDSSLVLFDYIISLFKGFIYLATIDHLTAKKYFEDAVKIYPSGMNAKFYLALTECYNNEQKGIEIIRDIIEFDKKKLFMAVEQKKLFLLLYTLDNFFFYNIFEFDEFAPVLNNLENFFEDILSQNPKESFSLNDKIIEFQNLEIDDEFLINSKNTFEFIDKYLKQSLNNENPFVRLTGTLIIKLFKKELEQIISLIYEKCRNVLTSRLEFFNKDIERTRTLIKDLQETLASNKEKLTKSYNSSLERVEKNYTMVITSTEEKLENLQNNKKFNPKSSFNNAMVYNIVISIFVFIIGGFSGCYGSSYNVLSDMQSLSTVVLITGFKWANITFLAGFIISLISAAMVLLERSGERQRLLQKISSLKNRKEKEKKILKNDFDKKLKASEKNYTDRIANCEENLNSLLKEKEEREKAIEEEIKKEVNSKTSEIQKIISEL